MRSPGVILANFDATVRDILEPYYRAFLHVLMQSILALEDSRDRRTWLFLDEFHTMKRVPGFGDFATNARSKGACIVLGFQNITSLLDPERYGSNATTIVGECKNKMFFKASTFEHAEWCAKEYGMHEFAKYLRGLNQSKSTRSSKGQEETTFTDGHNNSVDLDHSYLRTPGEFQALPLVADSGRFEMFSILRSARIPGSMSFAEATGPLLVPHPDHPGFIRTPAEWEQLRCWDSGDLTRLKLSSAAADLFLIASNLQRRLLN